MRLPDDSHVNQPDLRSNSLPVTAKQDLWAISTQSVENWIFTKWHGK